VTDILFEKMAISKKRSEKRNPKIEDRIKLFNIKEGMTIVDYGCGPGMYINGFSKAVGKNGEVFAVDVIDIARDYIEKIIVKNKIVNVKFYLAKDYNCNLVTEIADIVFALDILHGIENTTSFFMELYRICKSDGILIIDDGHQKRINTKVLLDKINSWEIVEETKDHIKLKKKK
jgi:ubiquinone/menaquinone biosynthesis C-methylase UbiE